MELCLINKSSYSYVCFLCLYKAQGSAQGRLQWRELPPRAGLRPLACVALAAGATGIPRTCPVATAQRGPALARSGSRHTAGQGGTPDAGSPATRPDGRGPWPPPQLPDTASCWQDAGLDRKLKRDVV